MYQAFLPVCADLTCDVAVVGGGTAGTFAALSVKHACGVAALPLEALKQALSHLGAIVP